MAAPPYWILETLPTPATQRCTRLEARVSTQLLFPRREWVTALARRSENRRLLTYRRAEETSAPPQTQESPREEKPPRRLILCLDGTGNEFCEKNSNVAHFFTCLAKDDARQLVYYQTGLGTYTQPWIFIRLAAYISKKVDEAIAWNLEHHVLDAYRFLMQNYRPGDKISLFGFSRGAYIARVLAGFIQKVGLLSRENHAQIPFAWNIFKQSNDESGLKTCAEYKKSFSVTVKIDFIGVWDTVASVGIYGKELPFAKSMKQSGIRVFRQALALDERRAKFTPNFLIRESTSEVNGSPQAGNGAPPEAQPAVPPEAQRTAPPEVQAAPPEAQAAPPEAQRAPPAAQVAPPEAQRAPPEAQRAPPAAQVAPPVAQRTAPPEARNGNTESGSSSSCDDIPEEDILEVWFAGCHSDVGGGSVCNDTRNSLARIPLRWMILECFRMETGIRFDKERLGELGFSAAPWTPTTEGMYVRSPPYHISADKAPNIFVSFLCFLWNIIHTVILWTWTLCRYAFVLLTAPFRYVYHRFKYAKFIKDTSKKLSVYIKRNCRCNAMEQPSERSQPHIVVEADKEDIHDALSPAYDQLYTTWIWWIFEVWPLIFRLQYAKRDELETRMNLGRGRKIYGDAWNRDSDQRKFINVHRSVLTRMKKYTGNYRPRAWFSSWHGEFHHDFHWEANVTEATQEEHLRNMGPGWECIRWVD